MVEIVRNAVTLDQINEILDWFRDNDGADDRGNIRSKNLLKNNGPLHVVEKIVSKLVDFDWQYANFVDVLESRTSAVRLHVDTDENDPDKWGKNILVPLSFEGGADTIWFNNHYFGLNGRFMHKLPDNPLFEHQVKADDGSWNVVQDIRVFSESPLGAKVDVDGKIYTITTDFLSIIDHVIALRNKQAKTIGIAPRISDYTKLTNYDPNIFFDKDIHSKYMAHLELEDLHGLTIDKIIDWKIGEAYMWDRSQLHCASSRHHHKIGLSIFVNRK